MRFFAFFLALLPFWAQAQEPTQPQAPSDAVFKKIKKGDPSPLDGYVLNNSGLAYLLLRIEMADSICEVSKKKMAEVCQLTLEAQREKYDIVVKDLTAPPREVYCPKCENKKKTKNYFWEGVALGAGVVMVLASVVVFALR
ncbi:MAG: hypothetical protein N3A54_01030 [Patescibacteria group bacterium]|nr:hypothetical protein [Patescibacteria group bacterium]